MRTPVTAVLFDFDHTLGKDHRLEERVMSTLARRLCGMSPPNAEIEAALARFRTGTVPLDRMLQETFAGWGYRGDVAAVYRAEALRLLPDLLEPTPGAADTLCALQDAGTRVAILTNGWTALQVAKASLIGFAGPVYVSEDIGAWKPDAQAFGIACDGLGVSLDSSLYVGDSPSTDVVGAKRAGMLAAWANLDRVTYPDGLAVPDFTITALDVLPDLVAAVAR